MDFSDPPSSWCIPSSQFFRFVDMDRCAKLPSVIVIEVLSVRVGISGLMQLASTRLVVEVKAQHPA